MIMPDISYWINEVSRASYHSAELPLSVDQKPLIKRKRLSTQSRGHTAKHLRPPLAATNPKTASVAMSQEPRKHAPTRKSPRKKPAQADVGSRKKENTRNSRKEGKTASDEEQTPTSRTSSRYIPVRDKDQRRRVQASTFSAGSAGHQSSDHVDLLSARHDLLPSVSSSYFAISSKRSRSPAKNAADLRFANIEMRSFEDPPPEGHSMKELIRDILASAAGIEIIPSVVREKIASANAVDRVWDQNIMENYLLSDEAALLELGRVKELVRAAADCRVEGQSEAAWVARVYDVLLRLALTDSKTKPWIITTASINPSLLPCNIITGDRFTARGVDLCITIEPDDATLYAIKDVVAMQPEPLRSINQTMHMPLRFRPIAVAIETKTELAFETGEQQLAIWTKAWLNRMKMLKVTQAPPLPLLRIVGNSVLLLIAWEEPNIVFNEDGEREERESTLVIQAELAIGDFRSTIGVYKLLKSIRRLARWADGPFRDWFKKEVVAAANLQHTSV